MLHFGVIGCEFASAWKSFGVDVTVVEALPRLLPPEDEQSSKALERAFRKRGIAFKTGKPYEKLEVYQESMVSLERIVCFVDATADKLEHTGTMEYRPRGGAVSFRGVSFGYEPGNTPLGGLGHCQFTGGVQNGHRSTIQKTV